MNLNGTQDLDRIANRRELIRLNCCERRLYPAACLEICELTIHCFLTLIYKLLYHVVFELKVASVLFKSFLLRKEKIHTITHLITVSFQMTALSFHDGQTYVSHDVRHSSKYHGSCKEAHHRTPHKIVCATFRKQGRISKCLHFFKYTVIFTCSMKIVYEMEANEAENKLSSVSIGCPCIRDLRDLKLLQGWDVVDYVDTF